jgi:hypothetical protein
VSRAEEHEEYTVQEQTPPGMVPRIDGQKEKGAEIMSLEVLYERCAGIDVHQRFVVVCLLVVETGKRHQEIRTFRNETADLLALRAWRVARTMHTCWHGKHGRLLDAGLSTSGGLL